MQGKLKCRHHKTLNAPEDSGKHLCFSVSKPATGEKQETYTINGVPVIAGNASIDIRELNQVFTGLEIDAAALRKSAWQRKR